MDSSRRSGTAPQGAETDDDKLITSHQDTDSSFEATLKDFERLFRQKRDSVKLYTAKVVELCDKSLEANGIRHTAMTSRIKSWSSAEGSLRRKSLERSSRRQLRAAVESKSWDWAEYCKISSLESDITEPFQSDHDMLNHLPDFGGARVSLYFPGDVERVSEILKGRFKIASVAQKHQSADVRSDLQHRLHMIDPSSAKPTSPNRIERSFSGYKATHFRVQLHDDDIDWESREAWSDLRVEIQVGTLVMHAWSEIEHDMIYKPLDSETISEDEVQLLDIINGIAATGEVALRQLEASTDKRRSQRARDKEAFATNHLELEHWLGEYCAEANNVTIQGEWEHMTQLYAILKASGDHRLGKILQSLEEIKLRGIVHRRMLPGKILEAICKPRAILDVHPASKHAQQQMNEAHFWATHLIYSLNMAIFLGVEENFLNVYDMPPRLRIAEILDIIHPTSSKPKYISHITDYCQAILKHHEEQYNEYNEDVLVKKEEEDSGKTNWNEKFDPVGEDQIKQHQQQLMYVAARLSRMGRVITSSEFGGGLLVPATVIKLLLKVADATSIETQQPSEVAQYHVQRSVDFMEYSISSRLPGNDQLAMWDRLTSPSAKGVQTAKDQWFLGPNPDHGPNTASWKLVDEPLYLDVTKQIGHDEFIPSDNISKTETGAGMDQTLELAYRLHPQDQWDNVRQTWKTAKAMPGQIVMASKKDKLRSIVTDDTSVLSCISFFLGGRLI